MEAIKRVRWQRIVLILLVLLIIVVGIVTVERRASTRQLLIGGTVTVTATATRASQTLQLAPQPTHILTSQSLLTPTSKLTLSPSPTTSTETPRHQWRGFL